MTDDDLWRWHAYHYAWRRVFLDDYGKRSPIDDSGEWFVQHAVESAERMLRERWKRPRETHPPSASSQEAIRITWREIPWTELTEAERDLARPEMLAMAEEGRHNIAAAAGHWRQSRARVSEDRPLSEIMRDAGMCSSPAEEITG